MNLPLLLSLICLLMSPLTSIVTSASVIGKSHPALSSDLMTPEALWSMGRIGTCQISPDGKHSIYTVTYYSVEQNKSHTVIYDLQQDGNTRLITEDAANETSPVFTRDGSHIIFLSNRNGSYQLWSMKADGSDKRQLSHLDNDISDFLLSPDEQKVVIIQDVESHTSIQPHYPDLPLASGMVIDDLNYKHWDHFVTSIPHPFLASFSYEGITKICDILQDEPYECPMLPFGGVEQLAWSPDSKIIAYTCRKKTGVAYVTSTDSDIYLYDTEKGTTRNICKSANYQPIEPDYTLSFKNQPLNAQKEDNNMGYDTNPLFSPDGQYIAWLSMERDGYESDRNRICVYNLQTGHKTYITESFQSGVDTYCWSADSRLLYFTGVWHGTSMVYSTNLKGKVKQLTEGICDYSILGLAPSGMELLLKKMSMSMAPEVYTFQLSTCKEQSLTQENAWFYNHLTMGKVEDRWIATVDGKQEQVWIIYPPHFDSHKKYPTLLFCEGGPQSAISQWWSFRWNFQLMAAQGYIVIAPNRRGLPGYGMEWLEEISGDYAGLCMKDYLSAIDAIKKEPYVDADRLGCVGASFGGYSVYWLAGHHEKRFKAFIAHDGIFNTHQQYGETEEIWFPNWDFGGAPWANSHNNAFTDSPHLSVDKWDTPILCIHGMKDYRILHSQAEAAFTSARLRGVPAQLLLLPDENHWVLKPQNGILWQRTYFNWLDKWLKH